MGYVYPDFNGFVGNPDDPDNPLLLDMGKPFPDDHPLVKARPELFRSTPPGVVQEPVEQATAAPGEKRATRRP